MHKLKTFLFFCILSLAFVIGQFIWYLNLPYTLSGFRIQTVDSEFIVTECFPAGPAYQAGIRVGDSITRINDLIVKEFAEEYGDAGLEESCHSYSTLYEFDKPYEIECKNGFQCNFTISRNVPFLTKLQCVSFDSKILFITGALFVLFGIVTSLFAVNLEGTSDFIWFMIAAGPCILNAYQSMANPASYTIFNLVVFDLASAVVVFSVLRIVAYFFMLINKGKVYSVLRKISIAPICLAVLRYWLVAIGVCSFFNMFFVMWPTVLLGLSFLYQFITFIILIRKMQQQPSVILRFFFLGFCFATLSPAVALGLRFVTSAFWVTSEYETLYTILPLLFIPFSVFCALLQTSSVNLDSFSGRLMNGGCSLVIISFLTNYIEPTTPNMIILAVLMVVAYIVLEKPVVSFLFPKLEYMQDELNNLEQDVFKCRSTRDILVASSDWLFSTLNTSLVAFCMFSDNKQNVSNVVYQKALDERVAADMLTSMIEDRYAHREQDTKTMIHKKVGFSVPFYLSHELVGFIFVGQKSKYSIFSNTEIRLVPPVARIIMESAMVVELNKKNRYVSDMQNRIVFSFADMIESRDGLTGQHVKRTSQIVVLIMSSIKNAELYGDELEDGDYDMIAMAAPLHDIGKIKVPDAILAKPGKLSEEEFAIIKTHPVEGERIISKTMGRIENEKYLKFAKDMALYHHEKWNGTGYPYGLAGREIPLCARIMAVADVFDALCSKRSYKEAYSIDRAFEIFEESKGSHFEPCLVELLFELRPNLERIYGAS